MLLLDKLMFTTVSGFVYKDYYHIPIINQNYCYCSDCIYYLNVEINLYIFSFESVIGFASFINSYLLPTFEIEGGTIIYAPSHFSLISLCLPFPTP